MVHLRISDSVSDIEPSAKYSVKWADVHSTFGACESLKAQHYPFQNSYLSAMIRGDEFFPEDRVHMLDTEAVADKAGLL